jgi:hypothetical protein
LFDLVVVGEAEVGFEEVASEWFVTLSVSVASAPDDIQVSLKDS